MNAIFKIISISIIFPLLFLSTTTRAYDLKLAKSYEKYFAPFAGKVTSPAMKQMKIVDFVKKVQSGKKLLVIDIRTPGEVNLTGFNVNDTWAIPMNEIFKKGNLDRIPRDRDVVVACKAGHRGMAITTGLRHIGFKNIYNLKGGLYALTQHLSPKTAYPKK